MEIKHTPGPWRVGDEWGASQMRPRIRIYRDVTYVDGAGPTTYVIGEVGYPTTIGNTVGAHERKANARLIAAAPDLLEALIATVPRLAHKGCGKVRPSSEWAEYGSMSLENCECEIKLVKAAIAKATGGAE